MNNKIEKQTAIGYIRVSSEEQTKGGLSLEAQRNKIESYCIANGFELVAVYADESVSGYTLINDRPQGKLAIKDLREGKAKHFVAAKLDRIFRNTQDARAIHDDLKSLGIGIHILDIKIDTTSAMGITFFELMAVFAQFESLITKERTKLILDRLKENGKAYSPTPYGFDNKDGLLIKNTKEQKAIKLICDLRQEGVSYNAIANELELHGYKPKTGKAWYASSVRSIYKRQSVAVS